MAGLHFQNGSKTGDKVKVKPGEIWDKTNPLFTEANQIQGLSREAIASKDEVIQAKLRTALFDKNTENKAEAGPGKPKQ